MTSRRVVIASGGNATTGPDGAAGVETVIDKASTAAVLAGEVAADTLVIATDVPNVMTDFGTPSERPLGRITVAEMRSHAATGQSARGSMGHEVEAALGFVEDGDSAAGGRTAVITLEHIADAGTVVQKDPPAHHRSHAGGGTPQEGHDPRSATKEE